MGHTQILGPMEQLPHFAVKRIRTGKELSVFHCWCAGRERLGPGSDWYVPHLDGVADKAIACCTTSINPRITSSKYSYDPRQQQFKIPRKVVKGGSHICAPNYCLRYRPAARQPQMIDTGMTHIGFRCIIRTT